MSNNAEPLLSGRKLKAHLHNILVSPDWEKRLYELKDYPIKKLISPLFSALFSNDPYLKWHAVTAFGFLFRQNSYDIKSKGEEIIRRCMWNLNEESGNIPWGMPEVIAEIMAGNKNLFNQFENIFISYISESGDDDNYLDFDKLRTGSYWGALRLASVDSSFIRKHAGVFLRALEKETLAENLIYICLCFGRGKLFEYRSEIEKMKALGGEASVYIDKRLLQLKIKEAAEISLAELEIY